MTNRWRVAGWAVAAGLCACTGYDVDTERFSCRTSADCRSDRQCVEGVCRGPIPAVTGVLPMVVDTGGGEPIAIEGRNFLGPGAQVALGTRACGEVMVESAQRITCVTPAAPQAGKVDVVVVNGGGAAGVASSPCAGCLEFRDLVGPKVVAFSPRAGARVSVRATAWVRFNEAIDPSTAAGALAIEGVAGAVFCSRDCTAACAGAAAVDTLCFQPGSPLAFDSGYAAVLAPAVKDLAGQVLESGGRRWEFRTRKEGERAPFTADLAAAGGWGESPRYRLFSVTGEMAAGEGSSAGHRIAAGVVRGSTK